MLDRTYPSQVCSIARTLEAVGERWSLLIVRDAFLGVSRFSDFQRSLGIARNVLTQRLEHLVAEEILEHREDGAYVLTRKGRELAPALHQLMKWGDRHYPRPEGPPRLTLHEGCGGNVDAAMVCDRCGELVRFSDIELQPGRRVAETSTAEVGSAAAAATVLPRPRIAMTGQDGGRIPARTLPSPAAVDVRPYVIVPEPTTTSPE